MRFIRRGKVGIPKKCPDGNVWTRRGPKGFAGHPRQSIRSATRGSPAFGETLGRALERRQYDSAIERAGRG